MDERVRQFRNRSRRGPCSEVLKALAVSYTREQLAAGLALSRVARELSSKPETLRRWLEEGTSSPFRAIEVVPSRNERREPREPECGIVLVTRHGHRVFGLDPQGLAQLLAGLG